ARRLRRRDRRLPRQHRRGRRRHGRVRWGRVRSRAAGAGMNGAARVIRAVSDELEAAGLRARIIARDPDSGSQVSLAPDGLVPLASAASASPTGAARFRHPAWLSVDDLLTLSVCFSDNTATDALLRLVPIAEVSRALNELGVTDIHVRHRLGDLGRTPLERLDRTEA